MFKPISMFLIGCLSYVFSISLNASIYDYLPCCLSELSGKILSFQQIDTEDTGADTTYQIEVCPEPRILEGFEKLGAIVLEGKKEPSSVNLSQKFVEKYFGSAVRKEEEFEKAFPTFTSFLEYSMVVPETSFQDIVCRYSLNDHQQWECIQCLVYQDYNIATDMPVPLANIPERERAPGLFSLLDYDRTHFTFKACSNDTPSLKILKEEAFPFLKSNEQDECPIVRFTLRDLRKWQLFTLLDFYQILSSEAHPEEQEKEKEKAS